MTWGTWGYAGVRCKLKHSNIEGDAFGYFTTRRSSGSRAWVVVHWDDERSPCVVPAPSLLFRHIGERTFKEEDLP